MIYASMLEMLAKHWKAAGLASLVALVAVLAMAVHHYRADTVQARAQASAAKASISVVIAQSNKNTAAVEQASTDAAIRAVQKDALRESINAAANVQTTGGQAIFDSPAISTALDGLRKPAPGSHAYTSAHHTAHVSR